MSRLVITAPSGRTVAGRLRDRDDVGDHILLLESPEPVAEPAVGDLDLVGDRQAAAATHRRIHLFQVMVGQRHAARVAVHRLRDERRGRAAVGDQPLDLGHCLARITAGVGAAELAAEAVGRFDGVHPIRPSRQGVRIVGHRRGDGIGGVGPPVVSLANRDDIASAGGGHRQAQRQIACLRTGIHQEHGVEGLGKHGGQPLAELDDRLIVEARVRVQLPELPHRGVRDPRVSVAEHRDVVDHVEIRARGGGHQEVPPAAFDLRRLGVVVLLHLREALLAARQQRVGFLGIGQGGQPEHLARIARQREPALGEFRRNKPRRRRCPDGPDTQFGPLSRGDGPERRPGAQPCADRWR